MANGVLVQLKVLPQPRQCFVFEQVVQTMELPSARRLWEAERALNELTGMRFHLNLLDPSQAVAAEYGVLEMSDAVVATDPPATALAQAEADVQELVRYLETRFDEVVGNGMDEERVRTAYARALDKARTVLASMRSR